MGHFENGVDRDYLTDVQQGRLAAVRAASDLLGARSGAFAPKIEPSRLDDLLDLAIWILGELDVEVEQSEAADLASVFEATATDEERVAAGFSPYGVRGADAFAGVVDEIQDFGISSESLRQVDLLGSESPAERVARSAEGSQVAWGRVVEELGFESQPWQSEAVGHVLAQHVPQIVTHVHDQHVQKIGRIESTSQDERGLHVTVRLDDGASFTALAVPGVSVEDGDD